jgi:hypothetical protein
MSPENDERIFERWPQFFAHKGDPLLSGTELGFRCADGWFQLIWALCLELELLADEFQAAEKTVEILQVKSKFGELRSYLNAGKDDIYAAIEAARQRSRQKCELCGRPGTRAVDGWWETLCSTGR